MAPITGRTIDTVGIGPAGLMEPGIVLTHVIIITGQIRSARSAPKKQTRATFGARRGHVDGTHLTTTTATSTISSIAT